MIRLGRACRAFAGTIAVCLLGGCAASSGYPEDPQNAGLFPNSAELTALRDKYFAPGIDDCYRAGNCTVLNLSDKQSIRNDVVLNRIRVYDMEFSLFIRDLSSANNSISLGSDLTALALNGLGATTGSAQTKAALAAASGGVIAANGAVDKDIFYQKTVPALVAEMQADRTKAEATILAGLARPDTEYPLQRAELDLDVLNDAGSLNSAVANITQKSADEKSTQQTQMDSYQFTRDSAFTSLLPGFESLRDKVGLLTDSQALALAKAMEKNLASRSETVQSFVKGNPNRLKDGKSARTALLQWIIMDDRSAATQKQWSDAIDAASKT